MLSLIECLHYNIADSVNNKIITFEDIDSTHTQIPGTGNNIVDIDELI